MPRTLRVFPLRGGARGLTGTTHPARTLAMADNTMAMTPPRGVTDIHIHIQPWEQLKPAVMETMRRGHEDHFDFLLSLMRDPGVLLEEMDRSGIWRVGLI